MPDFWDYGFTSWRARLYDQPHDESGYLQSAVYTQLVDELNSRAEFMSEHSTTQLPTQSFDGLGLHPTAGALVGIGEPPFPRDRLKALAETMVEAIHNLSNYDDGTFEYWTSVYKGNNGYYPGLINEPDWNKPQAMKEFVDAATTILRRLRYRRYGSLFKTSGGAVWSHGTWTGDIEHEVVSQAEWNYGYYAPLATRIDPILLTQMIGFQRSGVWGNVFRVHKSDHAFLMSTLYPRDNWEFRCKSRLVNDTWFVNGEFAGQFLVYAPFKVTQRIYLLTEAQYYAYDAGKHLDPFWMQNNMAFTQLTARTTTGTATNDCSVTVNLPEMATEKRAFVVTTEIHSFTNTDNWLDTEDPGGGNEWVGAHLTHDPLEIRWSGEV